MCIIKMWSRSVTNKMKGVKVLDNKRIGETLVELRKKRGQTIAEAASGIGVSPSALSMYENGERIPRDDIKIKISNYYKKSIVSIFFAK